MNRLHHLLIALLFALTTWSAGAQTTYRVKDVPNVWANCGLTTTSAPSVAT